MGAVVGSFQKHHRVNKPVSGINQFGLNLYKEVNRNSAGDNVFLSPFSISTALAMTVVGAKENTLLELKTTLGVKDISEEDIHQCISDINSILRSEGSKNGYALHIAYRLFCQKKHNFLQSFLDSTQAYYMAEASLVDFVGDTEGSRLAINQWVEHQTDNKVRDLIPQGHINAKTTLVLVNAIYFKGDWTRPFSTRNTEKKPFHITEDEKIVVNMMYNSESFKYGEDSTMGVKILELPYGNKELSMFILLPKQVNGLAHLESTLTQKTLDKVISKLRKTEVNVTLPKFRMEHQFELNGVLQMLGLVDIFTAGRADLSGMDGTKKLFISQVVHKTCVDVNEQGTEAFSGFGMDTVWAGILPEPPKEFNADHPFMFVIRDNRSQALLFLGRLCRPTAE